MTAIVTSAKGRLSPGDGAAEPSIETLIERAAALRPLLAELAPQAERDRRVAASTIDTLAGADLLRMTKPRMHGGLGMGPTAILRVGFELGRACGSTAWCAMLSNANHLFLSYWPEQAQRDVCGDGGHVQLAATIAPTGRARPAEGGWLIEGHWPFASNCDNAQWCFVACLLSDEGGKPAGVGWFLAPAGSLTIDQDSWNVAGMQGTGSKTLIAEQPLFVPAHRMLDFVQMQRQGPPGLEIPGNITAHFGFSTFAATCLVAPILGMAQGALDWFTDAMAKKVRAAMGPGAPTTAAENPFTQERAGRASSMIDAAVALVMRDVGIAEAKILAGETLDVGERLRVRRAFGFAARQAVDAVNLLIEGGGASASDLGTPIQRHWRDVSSAVRHVSLDTSGINMGVGQYLFGLAPTGSY